MAIQAALGAWCQDPRLWTRRVGVSDSGTGHGNDETLVHHITFEGNNPGVASTRK